MTTLPPPTSLPAEGVDKNRFRVWRNSMRAYLDQELDNRLFFPRGTYNNWVASIDNEDELQIQDISDEDGELDIINEKTTQTEAEKKVAKQKLLALRNAQLSKMLQNIANCCHFNNQYDIVSKSTSLGWIWNYLESHYNIKNPEDMEPSAKKRKLELKNTILHHVIASCKFLEQIFQYLTYNDLKIAALVCKQWNDVIVSSSNLWSKFNLLVNENNAFNLQYLRRPIGSVTLATVSTEILQAIHERQGLKCLTVQHLDTLDKKDAMLLATVVSRIESFSIKCSSVTTEFKCKVLFTKLHNGHKLHNLNSLNLTGAPLASVQSKVLCDVLKNIPRIELCSVKLSNEQTIELFKGFCETGKLKQLCLDWNGLSAVDPGLLSLGLKHVTCLNLSRTELTANQTIALFSMIDTNTSLTELDVGENNLQSVDPEILSEAIIKLNVICLKSVKMTTVQWTTLFKAMATERSCLIEANLRGNNLSEIDPLVVSSAVTNVTKINLWNTKLNQQQSSLIFHLISNQEVKIKHVDVSKNTLGEVDALTLAKCGYKLVSLNLNSADLSGDQLKIIFKMWSSEEVTLRQLQLSNTNLNMVNTDNFADVINNLEISGLWYVNLTNDQLTALFTKIAKMTSLKQLNISTNNLSNVMADLLAEAVNNIERVPLYNTKLTMNQASAILSQCEKKTKLTYLDMRDNGLDELEVSSKIHQNVKILF